MFIVSVCDGTLPLKFKVQSALGDEGDSEEKRCDPEEERRLLFVAMSRPKQKLYMTYHQDLSEFLTEIDFCNQPLYVNHVEIADYLSPPPWENNKKRKQRENATQVEPNAETVTLQPTRRIKVESSRDTCSDFQPASRIKREPTAPQSNPVLPGGKVKASDTPPVFKKSNSAPASMQRRNSTGSQKRKQFDDKENIQNQQGIKRQQSLMHNWLNRTPPTQLPPLID